MFLLAELLAQFIFSLFLSTLERKKGKTNRTRSSAEKKYI